jgi:FMN phosphatase YigB (HAD superfamily)
MASPTASASKQPTVILFDIGGVCVRSPFQAILDYEVKLGIPPGWVNYSISKTAPNGTWHRLERGEMVVGDAFYRAFTEDLHDAGRWRDFYLREASKHPDRLRGDAVPPVPAVDGRWLFDEMMRASRAEDPWMLPALQSLKASGRYILAALSNTVIFPPGHELHEGSFFESPLRRIFDVFISSAHVGLRKPSPEMYRFALETLTKFAETQGRPGLQSGDIVFLDDIGENLREARAQGFGTIKVPLGRAYEAVDKLEEITGLPLAGDHPKIPIETKIPEPRARI